MSLRSRIEALEEEHGPGEPVLVEIAGGLTPGVDDRVGSVGGETRRRGDDESVDAFRDRLRREAASRGLTVATLGGLPWRDLPTAGAARLGLAPDPVAEGEHRGDE